MIELGAMQQPLVHFRSSKHRKSCYFSQQDLLDSPVLFTKDLHAKSQNNSLLREINETPENIRLYNNAIDMLKGSDWEVALQKHVNGLSEKQFQSLTRVAGRLKNSRLIIALSYRWLGSDIVDSHIVPYVVDPAIQVFRKNIIVKNILKNRYTMNDYCYGQEKFKSSLESIGGNIFRIKDGVSCSVESRESGFFCVVRRARATGDKPWFISIKDSRTPQPLCSMFQKNAVNSTDIKDDVLGALGLSAQDRNCVTLLNFDSTKLNGNRSKSQRVRVFELYNDEQAEALEIVKKAPLTLFQAKKIHDVSKQYDHKLIAREQAYQSCKECLQPVLSDKIVKLDICFPK